MFRLVLLANRGFGRAAQGVGSGCLRVVAVVLGVWLCGVEMEKATRAAEPPVASVRGWEGDYEGLVVPTAEGSDSALGYGMVNLKVTGAGRFSGLVRVSGKMFSVLGGFGSDGRGLFGKSESPQIVLRRSNEPGLVFAFEMDPAGGGRIRGTLVEEGNAVQERVGTVVMERVFFDGKTTERTLPDARFTVAVPSVAQSSGLKRSEFPRGSGVGTLAFTARTGVGALAVTLADGTSLALRCRFNERKEAVFYTALYQGGGQFSGRMVWDETGADSDFANASVKWHKPQLNGDFYPLGWPEGLSLPLIGARIRGKGAQAFFPGLSSELSPNVHFEFSSGGLDASVKKGMVFGDSGFFVGVSAGDTAFRARLNRDTGLLSGEGALYGADKKTAFRGAVLSKGATQGGQGFFLSPGPELGTGTGKSGKFSIVIAGNAGAEVVISEFMAKNNSGIRDEDGDFSDWIEIYNPGKSSVNLDGWHLTDDSKDPVKWKFPAVILPADGFLVVWASGKNRVNPASPLHTNFSLSAAGEYLGLVRPDGETVEFEYGSNLANSEADESYGLDFGGKVFVGEGSQGRFLAGGDSAGKEWTQAEFLDGLWTPVTGGVGYGGEVPGIWVRQVIAASGFGGIDRLQTARNLLALPVGDAGVAAEKAAVYPALNILGDGGDGHYGSNYAPPISHAEPYVIEARALFYISEAGVYTFGLNSDDGGSIAVDGKIVMTDDSNHGPEDHLSWPVSLEVGWHSIEVVMWEMLGGDEVELFAAKGAHQEWNESFALMGAPEGIPLWCALPGERGRPYQTPVGTFLKGKPAAGFVRYAFDLGEVPYLESLILSVAYQDGFIAYLNGVELARRNAPLSGIFTEASRSEEESRNWENIDVYAQRNLLRKGRNVLAICGFKAAPDSPGFVLTPRLTGYGPLAGTTRLFTGKGETGGPSPGIKNSASRVLGKIGPVNLSVRHGFYDQPFDLLMGHDVQGVKIRYTLDGSTPSDTHGLEYKEPIRISKTTVVRSLAVKTGYAAGEVHTQTYVFPDDVLRQSPTGRPPDNQWPAGSVNGQVLRYGMNPAVVNHSNPAVGGPLRVKAALAALPTISVVTDLENLFAPDSGIWVNSYGRGDGWERPASVEFIGESQSDNWNIQANCGIRIRGGFSRGGDNPKHGLKLFFRNSYGGKLKFPLFGGGGAEEFEQLDLRTAQNYSWSFAGDSNNTFLREESARELQGLMGNLQSRVRYAHVYLNGQYWGIYSTDERPNASYGVSYMGGRESDYDVVKGDQVADYSTAVLDGNDAAWRALWDKTKKHGADPSNENFFSITGLSADGVTPNGEPCLLDMDNLIDYLLLNFWIGNLDGCTSAFLGDQKANNWFGLRNRAGGAGFRFIEHDAEHSFFNVYEDRTGPFHTAGEPASAESTFARFEYANPMFFHTDLLANAEYRMRWADRVQKHLFDGGALTREAVTRVVERLAKQLDVAIIAESARWGGMVQWGRSTPLTRLDWLNAKEYILRDYVPARGAVVLAQLQQDGLYPRLNPPRVTQKGGYVRRGTEIGLSADEGTVWFMLDGTDPREVGGGIRAGARPYVGTASTEMVIPKSSSWRYLADGSDQGEAWRWASFDDSKWPLGNGEFGYGDGDEGTVVPFVDVDVSADGVQKNATTYFRREFSIQGQADVVSASVLAKYDDALIVYINGQEVVRTPNISVNAAFNQYASSHAENEAEFFEFPISPSVLKEGVNLITAEVHQVSPDSSDLSFDLSLQVSKIASSTALTLDTKGNIHLKARALRDGEWSAILEADYVVEDFPNLKIFAAPVADIVQGGRGVMEIALGNQGNAATLGEIKLEARVPPDFSGLTFRGNGWTVRDGKGSSVSAVYTGVLAVGELTPPLTMEFEVDAQAGRWGMIPFTVSGGGDLTVADNTSTAEVPVRQTAPAVLAFDASSYRVRQEDGALSIRVLRTGNVSGTATVRVQTRDGSARQERDYSGLNEVLRFEDGDSEKEIVVSIAPNDAGESHEVFEVSLSGPVGASLGKPVNSSILILATDSTPPSLVKVEPPSGQSVRDFTLNVTGIAEDNRGVARVEVKLNGKKWAEAKTSKKGGQTLFQAALSADPGTNTVEVRCFDDRGNESPHIVRTYLFTRARSLVLSSFPQGGGSVELNSSESIEKLEEGKIYSVVARPKAGMVFGGWRAVGINLPSVFANPIVFRMEKGLELTASFVTSPFGPTVAGNYVGLITPVETVAPAHGNQGIIQLALNPSGVFSGVLKMDGDSFPFAGSFAPDGKAYFSEGSTFVLKIPRRMRPSLILEASLDLNQPGNARVGGGVGLELRTGITAFAQFQLERAGYDGKTPATSAAVQSFAVKLDAPSPEPGRSLPEAVSPGTISISKAGIATFAMTLADDTKFTVAAPLFEDDRFAVYSGLYFRGRGSFSGSVFTRGVGGSASELANAMRWFRPYLSAGGTYRLGWEDGLQLPLRRAPGGGVK